MFLLSRFSKAIRNLTAFQIILLAILIHSFASIFILYIHIASILITPKTYWKSYPHLVYSKRLTLNLLSNNITSSSKIDIKGWWMDHSKWDINLKSQNNKWSLSYKVYKPKCKPDSVRALYQYVPLNPFYKLKGLELSFRASTEHMETQSIGAVFGVIAYIQMLDGNSDILKIELEPSDAALSLYSGKYFIPTNTSLVSVTAMLFCSGFTGSVEFTDIALVPIFLPTVSEDAIRRASLTKLLSSCPVTSFKTVNKSKLKKEKIAINFKEVAVGNANNNNLLTLVTQVSMDRLSMLEHSLSHWQGPISLVIYVNTKQSLKETDWQRLYIQKKLESMLFFPKSHVTLVFSIANNGDYPINTLRNIALHYVETKYFLLVDSDFQPSPNLATRFQAALKFPHNSKTAFVIPAFEYAELPQKGDNVPSTKDELLQLIYRKEPFIQPFRMAESPDAHRLTDYWKWYRSDKPYSIFEYNDKYEPYIILQKSSSLPLYDERFLGYGMNKVSHITELYAAKYHFIILPDVWLLHVPHKPSSFSLDFLQNPYSRIQNRVQRFEFIIDLLKKYKLGPCSKNVS